MLGEQMYKLYSFTKCLVDECTNYIPSPNAGWTNVQTTFLHQMLGEQMYKLHNKKKSLANVQIALMCLSASY